MQYNIAYLKREAINSMRRNENQDIQQPDCVGSCTERTKNKILIYNKYTLVIQYTL